MKHQIKIILLILSCVTLFNCSSDDDSSENINSDNDFIGEWLRTDSTDSIQYKIVFTKQVLESDTRKIGYIISSVTYSTGEATSSLGDFNWTINNDILTLDDVVTTFQFLSNGEILLLPGFSEFEFVKQ
ncbi:hypothetical protein [Lacinutrix sp. Bg11-31]|uniref:hypothetical protein n=1 Tax=Lacinutrix sp. Bg11-31 TaxID=2057808 RepID=UPI000C314DBC|nr:hypothetical protein [Lacinutrix sp. Bg11-31]AUC81753.1 hypothetical protein CW733_06265 [Lacinutrix sp. Bg11-31]